MSEAQAIAVTKEIERILQKHDIHNKVEYMRTPKLSFVNISISIKITK